MSSAIVIISALRVKFYIINVHTAKVIFAITRISAWVVCKQVVVLPVFMCRAH